jgi:hypothetical protein
MAELIARLMILSICVSAVCLAFGVVVPWLTRKVALYGLHGVRDRVYAVAEQDPTIRKTRFYRDVEFLVTMAIHVVRQRPYSEAVAYLGAFMSSKAETRDPDSEERARRRLQIWERERVEVFEAQREGSYDALAHAPRDSVQWMILRVAGGKPVMQLVSTVTVLCILFMQKIKKKKKKPDPRTAHPKPCPDLFSSAVPRLPGTPPRAVTAEGLRAMRKVPGIVWSDQSDQVTA